MNALLLAGGVFVILGLSTAAVAAVLWVRRGRRSEQDLVPQNLPL